MAGEILNQVTCYYTKDTPIQTYTIQTGLSNWTWTGRTLSGLRDENGNFFPADGRNMTFSGNTAHLSAVWTLNSVPINIYLIGPSEAGVSVNVTYMNNGIWNCQTTNDHFAYSQLPHKPYKYSKTYTQTSSDQFPYRGCISATITAPEDVLIENLAWEGQGKTSNTKITCDINNLMHMYYTTMELSVTFTKQGILYYIPNQNYVNP